MSRRTALPFLVLAIAARGAAGQTPPEDTRPSVTAVRLAEGEAITLDGRFDESAWQRAIPATDFKQQIPQNGAPPTERTDVRFVYSRDALYMGVTCFDDEPDKLLGNTMKRDEGLRADDRFIWEFDTFLDARNGYYFEMNPSGLMADALLTTQGQIRDWDGIWNAHVRRSETGWTIEIELPFRTFNFNPNAEAWGVNFQRTVRRKNEESFWTGWGLNQGMRIQYTGLLLGIRDVSQGHGLELRPYGVTSALASPGRGGTATTTDAGAGMDVYYSVTPALRANVTVNTDFAQTEVDQRQVNLTQYSLFFPEKRGFFLEGASYFDFASFEQNGVVNRNLSVVPFFTRRIGLDANGDPQKIDLGLKLTGQAGRQDVGLMQIRTAREDGTPGEDFTALRVRRNVFSQSYVGALYTRRDARTRESAAPLVAPLDTFDALSTLGADFRLGTTTFHGNQNMHLTGFYLTTTSPLKQGKDGAWGANFEYPNDRYIGRFNYREVQDNYDPAAGFTLRNGYRRYAPQARFQPRPRRVQGRTRFGVQQYQFGVSGDLQYLTAGNDPLLRQWDFTVFQADFQSQEQIQVHVVPTYERLDRNFTISRGLTLPVGTDYDYSRYRLQVRTADRRMIAATSNYETGSFYSGDRDQVSVDVGIRPRRGVVLYLYGEWNAIALPEGHFTTRLYRTILDTQFNPWVSLSNNIQYDSVTAIMGWQSRFRWIITPGNDVYIVYNHNWLDDPVRDRFATLDRRASSKVLYTYRF